MPINSNSVATSVASSIDSQSGSRDVLIAFALTQSKRELVFSSCERKPILSQNLAALLAANKIQKGPGCCHIFRTAQHHRTLLNRRIGFDRNFPAMALFHSW